MFNLQTYGFFKILFLYQLSGSFAPESQNILYDLIYMKLVENGFGAQSGGVICVVSTPSYNPGVWSSGPQNAQQRLHPESARVGILFAPLYSAPPFLSLNSSCLPPRS